MALFAIGCHETYLNTCCSSFAAESDTYNLTGNYDLVYIQPIIISKLSGTDEPRAYEHTPNADEYLCSIAPMMQGLNNSYDRFDDKAEDESCSVASSKYPDLRNQIKEAYEICCFVVRPTEACFNNQEDWEKCQEQQLEYLACFRDYLTTQGECPYQID